MSAIERYFINGRFLDQPLSGIQRYGREVLAAIDRQLALDPHSHEHWTLLTTGRERDQPRLANIVVRRVTSRLRSHAWEQTMLWRAARRGRLINLSASGPILHPDQLVVIHDAAVYRFPQSFSATYGGWHRLLGRTLARRSRIATVSRFSASELEHFLHLPAGDIAVLPNSADHLRDLTSSVATIDRLKLGDRPFFLCLGSLTRSKNLTLAVAAIRRVPGARLVIVGGADSSVFRSAGLDLDGAAVVLAGRTSDAEVVGLLRNAAALIFPSRYEGFGIPPLEAMVSDCPVIAADIPAVREVCGEAAIYVSPDSPGDCAAAMARILAEAPADRAQRTAAGQARSALYSWDRTAKELLSIARQMGAVAGTDQSVSAIDCRT